MWTRAGRCQNLGKLLLVLARADLAAPPVCSLSDIHVSRGTSLHISRLSETVQVNCNTDGLRKSLDEVCDKKWLN